MNRKIKIKANIHIRRNATEDGDLKIKAERDTEKEDGKYEYKETEIGTLK